MSEIGFHFSKRQILKMKTIPIFSELNILFTVIIQVAVLDSKSLGNSKKKLFYHDQSLIKRVLNNSGLNKKDELTEKVDPRNIFRAHDIDNLNYTNNHGNPESVSYSYS